MSSILWYVHDHGRGHLERARAVLPHLSDDIVVVSGPGIAEDATEVLDTRVVALPGDVPPQPTATIGPWHHAPAGRTLRSRTAALVDVVARHDCTTAVVDVSVEVTVLARLLGLRTVTVRQSGRRTDCAHQIGLESADVVWIPQRPSLEPIDAPVDGRWFFSGPFSRLDQQVGRRTTNAKADRLVVLLVGTGGTSIELAPWREAALPDGWQVVIAGAGQPWRNGPIECVGTGAAIESLLARADVVVTSAGWAAVADTVAAGCRLVVVPEERPFDEQQVRADALAAADLAMSLRRWPSPCELPHVVDEAMRLDPTAWHAHHDGLGAQRSAAMIERLHRG